MNNTDKFFIQCLSDYLSNKTTSLPDYAIDVDSLYQRSKAHDLVGIVYYQLKKTTIDLTLFLKSFSASVFYYFGRERCVNEVEEVLNTNGIHFATVKGPSIANLYPVPALRTMGDIDLLIHEEDKEQINQLMLRLGYKCTKEANSRDWNYQNRTVEFEMHPLLIYPDEQVEKKAYLDFFNDFWPYVDEYGKLEPEFHLLFLLVHLRKHLLNHGAGMRQFMDIAVFTKAYRERMDWNWIEDKLTSLSLVQFSRVVYTFIERWFEIGSPLETVALEEKFYLDSTERILQNGVFGFQSEDNEKALISYAIVKDGKMGRIKNFLRMIFPGLALMKTLKGYGFLNDTPWLLPAAWFIRCIRIISGGNVKEKLSAVDLEASPDRIHMIKMWGMD